MRRALLIGSQTGGLSGVHADVRLLDETLGRHGFATVPTIGPDATADGIRGRYRELIQDTADGDVAVVYYSGHGGRAPNPLAGTDPRLPRWLQYIVPTDHDDRAGDRVRCVLAEELSLLQRELTERTANVVVILDCCHSARMSRDADLLPKANDQLVVPGEDLLRRWRELREDALVADANPLAVRLVACGPDQSAYESWNAVLGSRHGALTAALAGVLDSAETGAATWFDAVELIRTGLLGVSATQRPDVEGPADRLLFSLHRRGGTGVLPTHVERGYATLRNAALFGVAVGDSYALVGPGGDPAAPLGTAVVERIAAGRAVLRLDGVTADRLPPTTSAWPLRVALGRRPVAVRAAAGPLRTDLQTRLGRSVRLRRAEGTMPPLATVVIDGSEVQILDLTGEPLYATPLAGARLGDVVADVERLALADQVRTLASGAGPAELPPDVHVSYVRLLPDGQHLAMSPGEQLFVGDLLTVRFRTEVPQRYVAVFDIGVAGAVTLLSTAEPDGVTLTAGVPYELGPEWFAGGIELSWPDDVPDRAPRAESFVVIVTDAKVDRLRTLGQGGASRRGDGPASGLDRLIDAVAVGRREATPEGGGGVRYRVQRFDFVLHPVRRSG